MSAFDPKLTLVMPDAVEHWSLTTLREKLIKIGAKVVCHGRYITFQLAEVAIPRALFVEILRLIDRLRLAPAKRSNRRLGKPVWVLAPRARAFDWEPIRELQQGQRSSPPQSKAGQMTAPDRCITSRKSLANREPSTDDPFRT